MPRAPTVWFRKATGWYMTTVNGQQHKLSKDKGEARKLFYKLMGGEKKPSGRAGMSTRKLCDLYLTRTRENKGADRHAATLCLLKPFCAALGHRDPGTLKVHEVNTWLDAQEGWGGSTRAGFVLTLKAVFNWALAEDYLHENPLVKLRRRKIARRVRVLTPEERRKVIAAASPNFRAFLTVIDQTGCRPFSEAGKMTAAMIDFEEGKAVLKEHKNAKKGKSRVLFFPPDALAVLRELAEKHPTGLLFRTRFGTKWTRSAAATNLQRIRKALKMEPFVCYDFRHSYISAALVKGVPVEVVAELVGTSAKIIWSNYASVEKVPGAMRAAALKAVS
ncbi:MAG TPA: tyrosine-type recombinase/integrase [Urbifossiella sp.]|nr:tyrosine-type recombinase/integrase [Urbifossiella sp.]